MSDGDEWTHHVFWRSNKLNGGRSDLWSPLWIPICLCDRIKGEFVRHCKRINEHKYLAFSKSSSGEQKMDTFLHSQIRFPKTQWHFNTFPTQENKLFMWNTVIPMFCQWRQLLSSFRRANWNDSKTVVLEVHKITTTEQEAQTLKWPMIPLT